MLINNISTSNVTLQGSYTLSFNLIGLTENVDVFLKINDKNFVRILTSQEQGVKTYNGTSLSRGINNLILKINNSTEEYISEPFQIIVKENPNIANIATLYTDSNGKYRISFDLLGDDNFLYTVKLKIDGGTYDDIMFNQMKGNKVYEGTTTLGIHNIFLQATDGFDTFTSPVYSLNVKNNPPKLTYILVSNETSSGSYTLNYATSDIENSTLTHKLKIDNGSFNTISVSKDGNYYTYNGSGLLVGNHTLTIQISDGKDAVEKSVTVNILTTPSTNKEELRQSKVRYDFSYDSLKSLISNITEDRIFEFDLENPMLSKSMDLYSNAYSNFNRVSQQTIDVIGSKKVEVAKDDLKGQIDDVNGAVGDLEDTMNGVFKDGILSDSEKETIRQNLNVLAKEKVDVDKDYETLYANADLLDPHKSTLKTSYDDFVAKYTTLINTINNVINKVGIVDNADKANIDTAFANWRTSLGNYTTNSLKAINAIAKVKADNSADVIDKKYATIVLDPNTGIVSAVGKIQETVTSQGKTISVHESKITQLEGSITSSVSRDDVKSIIEQTPESVKIGFNGISDNVVINSSGLTVNRGSIACDALCTPSGHDPIIKLFGYDGGCALDATYRDNAGWGTAIRLKWDNENYLFINDNNVTIYQYGYQSFKFRTNPTVRDVSEIVTPNGTLSFSSGYQDGSYYNKLFFEDENIIVQNVPRIQTREIGNGTYDMDSTYIGSLIAFSNSAISMDVYYSSTTRRALNIDMTSTSTTRLTTAGGVLTCASHGLYWDGTLVSLSGHTHNLSDIYSSSSQSFIIGNLKCGTNSSGTYIGGYVKTSGNCRGTSAYSVQSWGGFPYSLSRNSQPYIDTFSAMGVINSCELFGSGTVKDGTCRIDIPAEYLMIGIETYKILITPIGTNNAYLSEKGDTYFVVTGEDCSFDYLIKMETPQANVLEDEGEEPFVTLRDVVEKRDL